MTDQEQKQIFSYNLIQYLQLNGKSQREVADAIGVSPQTFNTWCKGIALPRMGKVQRLADYFRISKTDLLDPNDFSAVCSNEEANCVIRIPVYKQLTDIFNKNDLPVSFEIFFKNPDDSFDYLGIQVPDTSLEPRFLAGDTAILRRQDYTNECDLFAVLWKKQTLIRRLLPYSDGLMLLATNPSYDPIMVSQEQIQNNDLQIIGRIIEMRVKF